ncbi:very long chain fatty acid elongase 4-like isoform X2 [Palaemon carinicauda]|uniref:very long chain fatty acid elongase 4-like isoform X2 n=1 Tax=Palaemon carinicauda TaxID=392227 RepID=UPI0035B5A1E7
MEVITEHWNRLKDTYEWSLSIADERVKNWPLMYSPIPTLAIAAVYLTMVVLGPKIMAPYKPFNLRVPLIIYNLGVMLLNLYIGVELTIVSVKLRYSWFCQPVDYSSNPLEMRVAAGLWWYYISKLVEFADTAFFILRKKNNQLTFLHVYHHCTMFCLWWIGIKWVAGGSSFLAAMMNSYVHVIMYLYYGLSAFGPSVQKYLWWKKHITCIQLVQFSSAGVLGIRAIFVGCDFPLWMQYALVAYMSSFIVLFGQFYVQAYRKKQQKRIKDARNGAASHQNGTNGMVANGFTTTKATTKSPSSHASKTNKDSKKEDHANGETRAHGLARTRAQSRRSRQDS